MAQALSAPLYPVSFRGCLAPRCRAGRNFFLAGIYEGAELLDIVVLFATHPLRLLLESRLIGLLERRPLLRVLCQVILGGEVKVLMLLETCLAQHGHRLSLPEQENVG